MGAHGVKLRERRKLSNLIFKLLKILGGGVTVLARPFEKKYEITFYYI